MLSVPWIGLRGAWRQWLRSRPSLGRRGEAAAARYLWWRGYRIVERNCRTSLGEIDLVAVQRRTVVFVEVKTRRTHETGHPLEAVTRQKQRRLILRGTGLSAASRPAGMRRTLRCHRRHLARRGPPSPD